MHFARGTHHVSADYELKNSFKNPRCALERCCYRQCNMLTGVGLFEYLV